MSERIIELRVFAAALVALAAVSASGAVEVETDAFRLVIGDDAAAESLVVKASGEECLGKGERLPLFASVQERPFNNETKLMHPNRRTTYRANRIRREGERLVVGFAVAPYEAVVRVEERRGYALFTLEGFRTNTTDERQYKYLHMDVPPVASFRVLQLPVRRRANFGEWLNVSWDERAAVAVVAADPYLEVGGEERGGFLTLSADVSRDLGLTGRPAALVVAAGPARFLDAMDRFERDMGLPLGVESRRSPLLNASMYWTQDVTPLNVDEHIAWAKKGGFRLMLIYYPAICAGGVSYYRLGDYDWRPEYQEKEKSLAEMLAKIKAAGITPGFHTLQTHIGMKSRYVVPDADPRLNKTMRFTLAQELPDDCEVRDVDVLEDVSAAPRHPDCRVLQFGGELLSYEGVSPSSPRRFTGVRRGHAGTRVRAHPRGEIGGVLDISEYVAISCYIDQRTDLQDEIAAKIAKIYDAGMEFCYFDGSEGVNPPCGINVALSQWRTTRAFAKPPLFTEGAAKSHFGWHLQAGANAFDMFAPEVFKEKIAEYPLAEAPVMRQDFTRVDFGWWGFWPRGAVFRGRATSGTQPDMWEYGTSKAAAWDSPASIMADLKRFSAHARADDIFETMRRWEDVRARGLLTPEQKEMLRDPAREFHLVPDGKGAYDLVEWEQIAVAGSRDSDVRAFLYERGGKRVVEYWHQFGESEIVLPNGSRLHASGMKTYETDDGRDSVKAAFEHASFAAEKNFAFRARLLDVHPARRVAADAAPVAADETSVDSRWRVVTVSGDPVVVHAARDLKDYLGKWRIENGECRIADGAIEISVDPSLKALQSKVEVGERSVRVTGATPREAYQGCIRLEDEMNARGRPALKRGARTYTRLFSPRMTHSGYAVETFPDEYLDQLAHSGMDAILVFIDDPPDVTRNGKVDMNALVARAAERGIDVWAYASFPEKAAKMHPLDPGAREWYAATYGAIVKNAPGLKGLICVGESCGFPSRDPGMGGYWWQKGWDRKGKKLNGFWPVSDWPEWLDLVKSVTREHNKDFEIVFWTYNWFKKPAKLRLPLLEKIPTDLTLLVTWVRGDPPVIRGNAEFFVTDYSIAAPGPSAVFRSEADVAVRRGIPVMTISNTGGRTWDSGVAPYEPTPGRWKARFDALKAGQRTWGVKALMESHHYGFQPNFISDLAKVAFTAETTDADFDRALAAIAERDFGRAAAPAALAAWKDWDDAFGWHSTGDSDFWGPLRVGPVYPLVMPGERLPPPLKAAKNDSDGVSKGTGWMYMMSKFSRPRNVLDGEIETCEREIALLEKGVRRLEAAMPLVPADRADVARRNLGVGAFHLASVRTLANVKRFYRAGLDKDEAAMLAVLDDEERNVREAMPLVEFDSSLGWEATMGYVCDRANLEWKLRQLQETRRRVSTH